MTKDNQSSNQLSSSITNLHLVAKQNLRGFLSRPFPWWLGLPPLKQPTANYKVLQTANGIGKYQTIYRDEFAKVLHEKSKWIVTILPLFHSSKLIEKPSFGDQTWRRVVVYAIATYLIKDKTCSHMPWTVWYLPYLRHFPTLPVSLLLGAIVLIGMKYEL